MSAPADKQIAEILAVYGEPFAGNVWRVQGTAVIYHKALERIAVQARIRFDAPVIVRAERDEAVILVTGHMPGPNGDRTEWSIGEALIGVNYRVSGKQAAYVFAMAEKRAKDRVILKLAGLHGLLYSEDEADEFKAIAATPKTANEPPPQTPPREVKQAQSQTLMDVLREFDQCISADDLRALWRTPEMKEMLASLEQAEYGVARAAFVKKGDALLEAA